MAIVSYDVWTSTEWRSEGRAQEQDCAGWGGGLSEEACMHVRRVHEQCAVCRPQTTCCTYIAYT